MEQWIRRNQNLIPWVLIAADLGIRFGTRLYKIKSALYQDCEVISSPAQELLPKLSPAEAAELPYPPDAYPGARDVVSPYGSLRVYEWGPEDGRKVVLIHGLMNPCVALGAVAHGLVDKGCRVMLFDLPGRGYSSTPSTPQSTRLYTTCILLALTSSPIAWTGGGTNFSVVGYSLGGGIAMNFASYFPCLVSSVVLLAPAGLVRTEHITFTNKLIYKYGLLSDKWVEGIVRSRLQRGEPPIKSAEAPATAQSPREKELEASKIPVLSRSRPGITISKVVRWQVDTHPGFVRSYISSLRYGPITNQHSDWIRIGERLSAQNAASSKDGLQNGKVLFICGRNDVVIKADELVEDATQVLGADNVKLEYVDAGHELPVTKSGEIVKGIWEFWQQ